MSTKVMYRALGGPKTLGAAPDRWDRWVDRVRSGLPVRSLDALGAELHLDRAQLAALLDVSPRTLSRWARQERLPADASDRLARVARVYATAARVLGSRDKAARWLHAPNRGLGGAAPIALLDTDLGTEQVEAALGRVAFGVVG